MKVKLLKKIRRRFSIYYNEKGIVIKHKRLEEKYQLYDWYNPSSLHLFSTREEAITKLQKIVRKIYYKHSKRFKQGNTKIYYNGI